MVHMAPTLVAKAVQEKRGRVLVRELSRLISSLRSVACRLRNEEKPLDASENTPAVEDNWEFTM